MRGGLPKRFDEQTKENCSSPASLRHRGRFGRKDRPNDLLTELHRGALNLRSRKLRRALDLLLCGPDTRLGLIAGRLQCSIALCLQSLKLLFAQGKDLRASRPQLLLIRRGFRLGGSDGAARLLDCSRGASAPLGQRVLQGTAHQIAVSDHEQDEKDRCRHSAEQ